ncbi:chemotaxis-specific protein-glutamate methyltransferase CheB [Methyloligella solikamskensis]|uniref:Protein-glutamate methylesterase/protein-glutamine glutaminase n=1 Tax=Methyloligella solikamskensis TaxID=1177756 RepID=A0ABW3J8H6_9HYPH
MSDAPATKLPSMGLREGAGERESDRPIRVMVVDDSHLMCWLLTRWIGEAPGLELAGIASSGSEAVATIGRRCPDVVLLDLEMPEMGGLEALPTLLKICPSAKVLVVSALTKNNAGVALDALAKGAVDYVSKPSASGQNCDGQEFRRALLKRIEAICRPPEPRPVRRPRQAKLDTNRAALGFGDGPAMPVVRKPFSMVVPRVIGVGSSTGGPEALLRFLTPLAPAIRRAPVLIAQHMPAEFTRTLAARLAIATGMSAKEGMDGEPIKPGHIYLAPGDRHMTLAPSKPPTIAISDAPPVRYYRPSVDLLFESLVDVYGPAVLGVVLTGMGSDGMEGAGAISKAGGSVIAQDQASSVVWGMPGAVSTAGYAAGEGTPEQLAEVTVGLFEMERP